MQVLGDYRFETRFYLDDERVLYVRGGSESSLISEELAILAPEFVEAVDKAHRHGDRLELLSIRTWSLRASRTR